LIYVILKNRARFALLRDFSLEVAESEGERPNLQKNSGDEQAFNHLHSPSGSHIPSLDNVPEESGDFAIGSDLDDTEERLTPTHSSPSERPSRPPSLTSDAESVAAQVRGLSEKAKGKMPAGMSGFSRQNSMGSLSNPNGSDGSFRPTAEWIESWVVELPLHTILVIIEHFENIIPRKATAHATPPASTRHEIQQARPSIVPSPLRTHSFEWTALSLGWYGSLFWSFVFLSEIRVASGTVGVWNGTAIRLFRVQEVAPEGPTLASPLGAVDAVGNSIVSRIGNMNLRSGAARQGSRRGSVASTSDEEARRTRSAVV
jgi:hypothetical protein